MSTVNNEFALPPELQPGLMDPLWLPAPRSEDNARRLSESRAAAAIERLLEGAYGELSAQAEQRASRMGTFPLQAAGEIVINCHYVDETGAELLPQAARLRREGLPVLSFDPHPSVSESTTISRSADSVEVSLARPESHHFHQEGLVRTPLLDNLFAEAPPPESGAYPPPIAPCISWRNILNLQTSPLVVTYLDCWPEAIHDRRIGIAELLEDRVCSVEVPARNGRKAYGIQLPRALYRDLRSADEQGTFVANYRYDQPL